MMKRSRDKFTRLAIVASQQTKLHGALEPPRRWAQVSSCSFHQSDTQPAAGTVNSSCMTTMPRLSRNWALTILRSLWNFVCSYFDSGRARRRRAVVLSFRRHALRMHGDHQALAGENFTGKKASGTVHWSSDHEVAPQEEGRA